MNMPAPISLRCGDYARQFPLDNEQARADARAMMRRNGCRSIRFEVIENRSQSSEGEWVEPLDAEGRVIPRAVIAHGYVGRMSGPGVEDL